MVLKRILSKTNDGNEGAEDSDLFRFVWMIQKYQNQVEQIIYKTKKSTIDPLDTSYNYTQPLQPQRSVTDNTYLSAPISELDSPNCISHANRFSTDLSKYNYNSRKISDISVNYNHNAPIKEYVTPRSPPRNKKLSNDLSPVSNKKSRFSEGISTIHIISFLVCVIR